MAAPDLFVLIHRHWSKFPLWFQTDVILEIFWRSGLCSSHDL